MKGIKKFESDVKQAMPSPENFLLFSFKAVEKVNRQILVCCKLLNIMRNQNRIEVCRKRRLIVSPRIFEFIDVSIKHDVEPMR